MFDWLKKLLRKAYGNCTKMWASLGLFWFVVFVLNPVLSEGLMLTLLSLSYVFGWFSFLLFGLKAVKLLYLKGPNLRFLKVIASRKKWWESEK